jgi:hypothetical protein
VDQTGVELLLDQVDVVWENDETPIKATRSMTG